MGAFCTCSRTSPFPNTDWFVEALGGEICSALLQARIDLATERGATVLSSRALEREPHLIFAVLYHLVRPINGRVEVSAVTICSSSPSPHWN